MGRGLSRLQADILKALESFPRPSPPRSDLTGEARTGTVIDAVGLKRSPASYASVSRALDRLARRGLVLVWFSEVRTIGKGACYSLPPCLPIANTTTTGPPIGGRIVGQLETRLPKNLMKSST